MELPVARLVIFDETVRGVDLPQHPVILGRSRKADIPIHDHLLSRKHCTIVPVGAGFRLLDLKSSNGTFLNGARIERNELKFDDIIEIGNTVIVLLDTDTWKRGEGLTRLRNPVKAQELIQAIKKRAVHLKGEKPSSLSGTRRSRSQALRQKRHLTSSEVEFLRWARSEWLSRPEAQRLLEDYLVHHVGSLIVRHTPELRDRLSSVLEKVLVKENFEGDASRLRAAIRESIAETLAKLPPPGNEREGDSVEESGPACDGQPGKAAGDLAGEGREEAQ